MKFFYAKTQQLCIYCQDTIERGMFYIQIFVKGRRYVYHKYCYFERIEKQITKWMEEHTPKKPGRKPLPPLDRVLRRKWIALLNYYKKKRNEQKVKELKDKLDAQVKFAQQTTP